MIDLDSAPADQIETLPRIGPVLAKRIVEDRAAHGPFGSLQGLERVRGVGPAMARLLQQRVTFGWSGRPTNAESSPR
ncbi:MAG: helix-hairpin-helix domain-containing protein [Gemmatimonadaceae bacterium]|nr:helix-hairpin-helix domain-containing protein [Gemmatimonadaceae bacterium]